MVVLELPGIPLLLGGEVEQICPVCGHSMSFGAFMLFGKHAACMVEEDIRKDMEKDKRRETID